MHAHTHMCTHAQSVAMRTLGGINLTKKQVSRGCDSLPRDASTESIRINLKSPFIRVLVNPDFLYCKPYKQAHFLLFFQNFLNEEIRKI